jgi:hypothetical protein
LGLERWYVSQIIRGLSNEEKQSLVRMITDEFIASMSAQDRKEMVRTVLPDIVDQLMAGMNHADRKELIGEIMPVMISQLGQTEGTAHEKRNGKADPEAGKEKRR